MTSPTNNENGVTLDELAVMIKHGFDSVSSEIGTLRGEAKKGFEKNTREHEDISLRLDNVAYRFELLELQKRVEALEKAVAVKK